MLVLVLPPGPQQCRQPCVCWQHHLEGLKAHTPDGGWDSRLPPRCVVFPDSAARAACLKSQLRGDA